MKRFNVKLPEQYWEVFAKDEADAKEKAWESVRDTVGIDDFVVSEWQPVPTEPTQP